MWLPTPSPVLGPWPLPCPRGPTRVALGRGEALGGCALSLTGPPFQNPDQMGWDLAWDPNHTHPRPS